MHYSNLYFTFVANKTTILQKANEKQPAEANHLSHISTAKVRISFVSTTKNFTTMKKVLKTVLAVACFAGIILAGCENPDGSCNLIWTLGFLALATIAGYGLKKMEAK